jgi:L-iditol 2-dehydrogenase
LNEALPSTMRGAMLLGPEQLEVREVPVPRPGPGELLMRIRAATTCGTDVKVFLRGGHPRMLSVPTLFGHEMAGTVVALGSGVDAFREGDGVVVTNSASCGECAACRSARENLCEDLVYLNGAYAEYLLVPARFVARSTHPIPDGVAFEIAALTEPLACVLHGVEVCELDRYARAGAAETIVYGAGPIGLLFVAALARAGHRVILADPNSSRLQVGTRLGAADSVLIARDGNQFARVVARTESGRGAQVAVDCTGVPTAWEDAIASVAPGGLVNLFGGCPPGSAVPLDTHRAHYSELTIKGAYHHRPVNVRHALTVLSSSDFQGRLLLSRECGIDGVEDALRSMMRKETLKVVVRNL